MGIVAARPHFCKADRQAPWNHCGQTQQKQSLRSGPISVLLGKTQWFSGGSIVFLSLASCRDKLHAPLHCAPRWHRKPCAGKTNAANAKPAPLKLFQNTSAYIFSRALITIGCGSGFHKQAVLGQIGLVLSSGAPGWWVEGGSAGARPDLVWSPPVSPGLGGGPGGWVKGGPRTRPDQFGFRLFRPGVGGNWGGEGGP